MLKKCKNFLIKNSALAQAGTLRRAKLPKSCLIRHFRSGYEKLNDKRETLSFRACATEVGTKRERHHFRRINSDLILYQIKQ